MTAQPADDIPSIPPIPVSLEGPDDDHPMSDEAAELRRRAEQVGGGAARAAVLGVSDGLVTNLSVILGVAGADASRSAVRLAGFASLVAGAFSMAAGEWVSVRAQVDLYRGVLSRLRRLYVGNRPLVLHELKHHFQRMGLDLDTASTASSEIIAIDDATGSQDRGLDATARMIVGVNPEDLGSPWTAAISSLLLFSIGALVPLLPWFLTSGAMAITWSVVLTAVSSVVVGLAIAKTSDESAARGALRQLLIVALAAGVTFGVGRLFGTAVS